jgi:hypothetical protein
MDLKRHHDIQPNDTQHNDTIRCLFVKVSISDSQHNDNKFNNK